MNPVIDAIMTTRAMRRFSSEPVSAKRGRPTNVTAWPCCASLPPTRQPMAPAPITAICMAFTR